MSTTEDQRPAFESPALEAPALESPLSADGDDFVLNGQAADVRGDPDASYPDAGDPEAEGFTLSIDDLLPAEDGSVIFDAELGVTLTDAGAIQATGTAPPDARAGGMDVGGYQFVSLESGLTLYYPAESIVLFPDG